MHTLPSRIRHALTALHTQLQTAREWLYRAHTEQRGDITERTIIIAFMVALAVGVLTIIGQVVFDYATSIPQQVGTPPGGGA